MKKRGYVRIISGQWKSRRIQCANVTGLRPSTDLVRETLFNWLPHQLHDKSCLDLFAGSGALGFEAASRGATKVCMVESNSQALELLEANRQALDAESIVEIFSMTVQKFLQQPRTTFDLIFMDPPFETQPHDIIAATCETLQKQQFCNPGAMVYIESPYAEGALPIPSNWRIIQEKRCGIVQSTLIQT